MADPRTPPTWKRWLSRGRFFVFGLVAIGLVLACRKAIAELDQQIASLHTEIAAVDERLSSDDLTPQQQATLASERQRLQRSIPTPANIRWSSLALAAFFYGLGLLPPGLVLHRAANNLGIRCSRSRAMVAQVIGHLGKYIPGKAMVVVMRVGLLLENSSALPAKTELGQTKPKPEADAQAIGNPVHSVAFATTAVFFETLLMMSVGGTVAGALICWSNLPTWIKWAAAGMAIVSVVPTLPPVMDWLVGRIRLMKSGNANQSTEPQEHANHAESVEASRLTWAVLAVSWCWMLVSWILIGASFTLLIDALPLPANVSLGPTLYASATAAIALGIVLGFASLIPGGAGVREAVTLAALTPTIGGPAAVFAALAARLLFLAVELLMATSARMIHRMGLA